MFGLLWWCYWHDLGVHRIERRILWQNRVVAGIITNGRTRDSYLVAENAFIMIPLTLRIIDVIAKHNAVTRPAANERSSELGRRVCGESFKAVSLKVAG